MPNTYPHLPLPREEPILNRRPGSYPRIPIPEDIRSRQDHGRRLQQQLEAARRQVDENIGGFDERRLFRFTVNEAFDYDGLRKLSREIEFVSQESKTVIVGFANEKALAVFESRLASLVRDGEVTNEQVYFALQGVDGWSDEDRKGWALKHQGFPREAPFLLDVELWPLESGPLVQERQRNAFEGWLREYEIDWVDRVHQTGLTLYRVRCDHGQGGLLLKHRDVRSVDLPPSIGLERVLLNQDIQDVSEIVSPPDVAPGVVVLDTGIASAHPLLGAAMGDAQCFIPGHDASDEHGHGTHVAGLALYGDFEEKLRAREFIPELRLFSGRILNREGENNTGFIEKHIENAVRHFVEQYNCRVFNLSFGDSNKPYHGGHVRGLSLTLDSLARELGVLFVVSAGNHCIGDESPDGLAWLERYPDYLLNDAWRIIEPAPALNVLTVGSLARYDRTFNSQRNPLDPAERPVAKSGQPSPFTRHGPSVDGAIKPELVAYGGNWAINTRGGINLLMQRAHGLGVLSTSNAWNPPQGRPFAVECGTSMAAPQVAHLAASLLKVIPDANVNLLRALLCANAVIPQKSRELFPDRKNLMQVCGYGMVDVTSLHRSLENAVTLISNGSIENKRHHFYEIPVPEVFTGSGRRVREIAVSLAYTPVVRSTRIGYRATRIVFKLVLADDINQIVEMFSKIENDDEKDIINEMKTASHGSRARGKGTVQSDVWKFRLFSVASLLRNQKLFAVVTRSDFPWGESLCNTNEDYSLVVCLRDRDNAEAQLYTQVKLQLQARARARARV